jgi:hypothetical protein
MVTQETPEQERFREQLGVLEKSGKRHWIYPKQVNGFFTKLVLLLG